MSPHSHKVGSFQSTLKVGVGGVGYDSNNYQTEPLLLIVVSVSEGNTADIIFATKDWKVAPGLTPGPVWRRDTAATLSGPILTFDFYPLAKNRNKMPVEFTWRDANSGSVSSNIAKGWSRSSFTRLDG